MSISLSKGQKISLTKEAPGLKRVVVGLGWDEVKQPRKLFSRKPAPIDCDASAILLKSGKLETLNGANGDVVYFGNLKHFTGAVTHLGDNLTGEGEGDDEQIIVELDKVPAEYDKIMLVVNIYKAKERNQHFGLIENAFIRIVDDKGKEIMKYSLTESYPGMTAMIFGELYRHDGEWKFNAVGSATNDGNLSELCLRFR